MKNIDNLETIVLNIYRVKSSTGLDYYLVKNNIGGKTEAIPLDHIKTPKYGSDEYYRRRRFVAKELKEIITKLNQTKFIGDKKVKIILSSEDSISLNIEFNRVSLIDVYSSEQMLKFEKEDIEFFYDITLEMKDPD